MSRGHGASRRRNYGRRQSEVRHRSEHDLPIDLQGPDAWARGSGWDAASALGATSPLGAASRLGATSPRGASTAREAANHIHGSAASR